MLSAALGYAARGWPVIPIELDSKAPLTKLVPNGVAHATTDVEVITYWWTRRRSANIGIAAAKFLVVDIDPRNGGDVQLQALIEQHGSLPTTPTQRTGGGGLHYLFRRPSVALVGKLAPGIDLVSGVRRYILAAPSIVSSGKTYQWITPPTVPLADAPSWLIAMGRRSEPHPFRQALQNLDRRMLLVRAHRYAAKMDPAVSGQHGHDVTFRATCALVRNFSGLDDDELMAALRDWNLRCSPPWSERELLRKISEARRAQRAA
jgi:hypothetical protein